MMGTVASRWVPCAFPAIGNAGRDPHDLLHPPDKEQTMHMKDGTIENRKIVSQEEWIEARKKLLVKEKEFTRMQDELNLERRSLPWARVTKQYLFDGPNGKETLGDLFDGRSQLIIYHFMFGPND